MASVPKNEILRLYKTLLRESQKFHSYNFRMYAVRKIRDSFRENKSITDLNVITSSIQDAKRNLSLIQRQVVVGNMYTADKLVIENIMEHKV